MKWLMLAGILIVLAGVLVPTFFIPVRLGGGPAAEQAETYVQFFGVIVAIIGFCLILASLPQVSSRLRFSIRDLLWLTVVFAMGIGWWVDHRNAVAKWTKLHYWYDHQNGTVHFAPGNTVDGAHKIQGTVDFPDR